MKATLDYKKGFYARFRTLKIYIDEGDFLTNIKQGQKLEVNISSPKIIYGEMDGFETDKFDISPLFEGANIKIVTHMSFIIFHKLPIEFFIDEPDNIKSKNIDYLKR